MHSTESIISTFKKAALTHGEATLLGNYRLGNQCYDILNKCYLLLKEEESIDIFLPLLQDENDSVATWAATYLLRSHPKLAFNTLQAIASKQGIIAFNAEMVLNEWQKGTLRID